jgi:hypothetical protein
MYLDGPNAFTIACEGSDIWNAADGFNFLYEQKSGDFDIVVRTKKITHTSNWAKGGLMVRESLDATSQNWNVVNDPLAGDGIPAPDGSGYGANVVECNARNTPGGDSGSWASSNPVPAYPNAWVRLQRVGTVLTGYASNNGLTWTQIGQQDTAAVGDLIALPNTVYVGICTTAHNNDVLPNPPYDQLRFLNTVSYDGYNSAYVPSIMMNIAKSGASVIISWSPPGMKLYSSTDLKNWTEIIGATNPSAPIPATGTAKYFMVGQ